MADAPVTSPLLETARRVDDAFAAGDLELTVELLERDMIATWFGLSTERFGEIISGLSRPGVPESSVVRSMRELYAPREADAGEGYADAATVIDDPRMAIVQGFKARLEGRPVEAMRLMEGQRFSTGPLRRLFDSYFGWGLFEPVQVGTTAMLAGDFETAKVRLTEARMHTLVPSLAFLTRDAAVKLALLHMLWGDPERAETLLAESERVPRTESWAEVLLDAVAAVARAMRPGASGDEALRLLDSVPPHAVGEMWPFYVNALHRALLMAGRGDEVASRFDVLEQLPLPRVPGQGFAGSAFELCAALQALSVGDISGAFDRIGEADGEIALTRLARAAIETITGRPRDALRTVSDLSRETRGFRQLDLWRLSILASAHLALGESDECRDVLSFVVERFGELTDWEHSFFVAEVIEFAGREVAGWADAAPREHAFFTGVPEFVEALTPRELEVLEELALGRSREEIARAHFVSLNTLKGHLRSIYRKLKVNSRAAAVLEGERRGLI